MLHKLGFLGGCGDDGLHAFDVRRHGAPVHPARHSPCTMITRVERDALSLMQNMTPVQRNASKSYLSHYSVTKCMHFVRGKTGKRATPH